MRHWHVEWRGPLTHTHIRTSVIPYFFKSQDLCVDKATLDNCYRLETYRSAGSISASANQQLRCHFISKCNSPKNPPPLSCTDGKTDILTVSDPVSRKRLRTQFRYTRMSCRTSRPVLAWSFRSWGYLRTAPGDWYKLGRTTHFSSALSKLYHFYSLFSAHKYIGASDSLCFRSYL